LDLDNPEGDENGTEKKTMYFKKKFIKFKLNFKNILNYDIQE
jgi:hypothetical protein